MRVSTQTLIPYKPLSLAKFNSQEHNPKKRNTLTVTVQIPIQPPILEEVHTGDILNKS